MPVEIYEIVALAARFWFLFLMVLIVWRSYRWYARERRQRKKRLRLLPDAGYIGELVVIQGAGDLPQGQVLPVPFEGTLGFLRSNDLCIPAPGVANRHLWFSYDSKRGLVLTPVGANDFSVDQVTIGENPEGICMAHGSRLYVGECELRLRMFAGYEVDRVISPPDFPEPDYSHMVWEDPNSDEAQGVDPGGYVPYEPGQLYGLFDQPVGQGQPAQQPQPQQKRPQPMYDELDPSEAEREAIEAKELEVLERLEALQATIRQDVRVRGEEAPTVTDSGTAAATQTQEPEQGESLPKENIFAAAYRKSSVKSGAERAKEIARQKAALEAEASQNAAEPTANHPGSVKEAAEQAKEAARQKAGVDAPVAAGIKPAVEPNEAEDEQADRRPDAAMSTEAALDVATPAEAMPAGATLAETGPTENAPAEAQQTETKVSITETENENPSLAQEAATEATVQPVSVKAAAEQAKEAARQKAGLDEAAKETTPAAPKPRHSIIIQPSRSAAKASASVAADRPAEAKAPLGRPAPLMSNRPLTPLKPRPMAQSRPAQEGTAAPETSGEAWPVAPRAEGWRSEGLFDDLHSEDGTDASMPHRMIRRNGKAGAKTEDNTHYVAGGDAS